MDQMTLGEAADRLYETRQARYAKQKEVDLLKEEETKLETFVIDTMPKTDTGAQGRTARVTIKTETEPVIEDFVRLVKYCNRTRNYDLLGRRLSPRAIKDRWETGKRVPGIGKFQRVYVSLNKV